MEKRAESNYVYMVECEDHSLYTGITTDIRRRMCEHLQKGRRGAKYTHSRTVKEIKMVWKAPGRASAARLEYAIKGLKRADKLLLICDPEEPAKYLPKLSGENYICCRKFCLPVSVLISGQKITD